MKPVAVSQVCTKTGYPPETLPGRYAHHRASPQETHYFTQMTINLLEFLGFIVNKEKSVLTPTRIITFPIHCAPDEGAEISIMSPVSLDHDSSFSNFSSAVGIVWVVSLCSLESISLCTRSRGGNQLVVAEPREVNGNLIILPSPNRKIFSDSALKGWGAFSGYFWTNGRLSATERKLQKKCGGVENNPLWIWTTQVQLHMSITKRVLTQTHCTTRLSHI